MLPRRFRSGVQSLRKGNPALQGAGGKPLLPGLDRFLLVAALAGC